MPLAKVNTHIDFKITETNPMISQYASRNLLDQTVSAHKEVFTFNSLNPQSKKTPQAKKQKVTFETQKP